MRILHFGRNTANQPKYIVKALRRMGHTAEIWEYGEDRFGFEPDRSIPIASRDPRIAWDTMTEALDRFDVIHFHTRLTFFPGTWGGMPPYWDLPILRALGKRVFVTFHGSEARIKRIHLEANPWSYFRYSDIEPDDDLAEKAIQVFTTYANAICVVSVDTLSSVPNAVVVPRTIDLEEWPQREPTQRDRPVVLHVPSMRGTKGTDFVLSGIETLRAEGVELDFKLLEGVSHAEARAAIADADVVIDNVITGDYELVSIEAMASSRVAVANIQDAARRYAPDAPVYSVDPDTFVERMRALIGDRPLRQELAARGRAFVERTHGADAVASTLVDLYEREEGKVPIRTWPDWVNVSHARKLEALDERVFKLQQQVARLKAREATLKAKLEEMPAARSDALRAMLPPSVRRALGRVRRRVRRSR